jgi:hypothetical protein
MDATTSKPRRTVIKVIINTNLLIRHHSLSSLVYQLKSYSFCSKGNPSWKRIILARLSAYDWRGVRRTGLIDAGRLLGVPIWCLNLSY